MEGGDLGTGDDPLNFLPQEEFLGIILGDGLGKNGESKHFLANNTYNFNFAFNPYTGVC